MIDFYFQLAIHRFQIGHRLSGVGFLLLEGLLFVLEIVEGVLKVIHLILQIFFDGRERRTGVGEFILEILNGCVEADRKVRADDNELTEISSCKFLQDDFRVSFCNPKHSSDSRATCKNACHRRGNMQLKRDLQF